SSRQPASSSCSKRCATPRTRSAPSASRRCMSASKRSRRARKKARSRSGRFLSEVGWGKGPSGGGSQDHRARGLVLLLLWERLLPFSPRAQPDPSRAHSVLFSQLPSEQGVGARAAVSGARRGPARILHQGGAHLGLTGARQNLEYQTGPARDGRPFGEKE